MGERMDEKNCNIDPRFLLIIIYQQKKFNFPLELDLKRKLFNLIRRAFKRFEAKNISPIIYENIEKLSHPFQRSFYHFKSVFYISTIYISKSRSFFDKRGVKKKKKAKRKRKLNNTKNN